MGEGGGGRARRRRSPGLGSNVRRVEIRTPRRRRGGGGPVFGTNYFRYASSAAEARDLGPSVENIFVLSGYVTVMRLDLPPLENGKYRER